MSSSAPASLYRLHAQLVTLLRLCQDDASWFRISWQVRYRFESLVEHVALYLRRSGVQPVPKHKDVLEPHWIDERIRLSQSMSFDQLMLHDHQILNRILWQARQVTRLHAKELITKYDSGTRVWMQFQKENRRGKLLFQATPRSIEDAKRELVQALENLDAFYLEKFEAGMKVDISIQKDHSASYGWTDPKQEAAPHARSYSYPSASSSREPSNTPLLRDLNVEPPKNEPEAEVLISPPRE